MEQARRQMVKFHTLIVPALFFLSGILFGCQPTVYLMPTPAVISTGEHNPFALNPDLEETTQVKVFYATNRVPVTDASEREYSIYPGDKLYVGIAHLQIGQDENAWTDLFKMSTSDENGNRPALILNRLEEIASLSLPQAQGRSIDEEVDSLPPAAQDFFTWVNEQLSLSYDKDLMVYVHGANANAYRASAQAAQYRHFTGRNSVVLVFLWPSAENILAYGTDVRHAKKSAPAFAHFIKMLSKYTVAEHTDILAYSAGAQVASLGLGILGRDSNEGVRAQLRLGEVYFAAADVGIRSFAEDLMDYIDLPRSVTISVNLQDTVLGLAASRHREARVGQGRGDGLSPETLEWVRNASNQAVFNIIGVDSETVPGMSKGSHGFWYSHPWVSSDVLVQLIFNADPASRGLKENQSEGGARYWTFPPDYPERIIGILRDASPSATKPK
jgi:esterase/lipase superfamily enzyme